MKLNNYLSGTLAFNGHKVDMTEYVKKNKLGIGSKD